MARSVAFVACLVALIAQASAFMFAAPGTVVGAAASIRAQGAAVSGFTGYSPVCQREATADHSTLRMMVRVPLVFLFRVRQRGTAFFKTFA